LLIDGEPVGRALALVFLLSLAQCAQLEIPFGFQCVGNQPVGGIHVHVALACGIGFVLRPFNLSMAEAVGLIQARSDFLLNGKRQIQRHWRDGIDRQLTDSLVDAGSYNALTEGISEKAAPADADIVGDSAICFGKRIFDIRFILSNSLVSDCTGW
jgi:hypothetical protein